MSYRIPDEEVLSEAIRAAFRRTPHVSSQREMAEIVNRELAVADPLYRAGAERIRRTGIDRNLIEVAIDYCRSEGEPPTACPVCGNTMEPVRRMTLDGEMVETGRSCSVCPYSVGRQRMMPARYGFTAAAGGETPDTERRIRLLQRARQRAEEAAGLTERALHMTGLQQRGRRTAVALRGLAGSDTAAGSIANLIRDLEAEADIPPLWTRPLVSVKHRNRKDI